MRETFVQLSIYFTVCMLAVTLCINFVSATGIFNGEVNTGVDVDDSDSRNTILGLVGNDANSQGGQIDSIDLWALIGTATGIVGIALYALTGNTTVIGAWIFSAVFWGSWLSLVTVTEIGGFIPVGLIVIGTTLMIPMFIGALVGIFSGGG